MSTSPPLTVLLLATAVATLLLAASSVSPAAAAAISSGGGGGGRMVFVHGGTGTKKVTGGDGARGNEWRHFLARVEDEVAPEFGGILATNSRGGSISNGALNKNRPGCQSGNQCAAKGGGSYSRPCTFKNQCPHGP